MLQRIAAELLPRLSELSSLDVTRCAKSLAFLKWLHLPLFEGFAQVGIIFNQINTTHYSFFEGNLSFSLILIIFPSPVSIYMFLFPSVLFF